MEWTGCAVIGTNINIFEKSSKLVKNKNASPVYITLKTQCYSNFKSDPRDNINKSSSMQLTYTPEKTPSSANKPARLNVQTQWVWLRPASFSSLLPPGLRRWTLSKQSKDVFRLRKTKTKTDGDMLNENRSKRKAICTDNNLL